MPYRSLQIERSKDLNDDRTAYSLSKAVEHCMGDYFQTLDGHMPAKLYDQFLAQVEPPLLVATLKYYDGNQSKTAESLGLNRATLRKKLRQYSIKANAL